jgi:hypothetical protein
LFSRATLRSASPIVAVVAVIAALPAIASAGHHHHQRLPKAYLSALSPQMIGRLSHDQNRRVIVLLRNQFSATPSAS